MKCLSLPQPFATFVVLGHRRFELRPRPTRYRGVLGIHAGSIWRPELDEICYHEPVRALLKAAGFTGPSALPRGMLLGTAALTDCVPTELLAQKYPKELERLAVCTSPSFAWAFEHPALLPLPIPLRGRNGIFEAAVALP